MNPTYHALCEHGYANHTPQDLATEADKSKASIHYNYNSKDQLFVAFLEVVYEKFTDRVHAPDGDTPREQFKRLLQILLTTDADPSRREFRTGMLELKASYNPALQERLTEFNEFLLEQLRKILAVGVDTGEFDKSIEPARDAEFLTTMITDCTPATSPLINVLTDSVPTMTRYIGRHPLADEHPEVAQ